MEIKLFSEPNKNYEGNYSGQYYPPSARPTTPVYFDASAEV